MNINEIIWNEGKLQKNKGGGYLQNYLYLKMLINLEY